MNRRIPLATPTMHGEEMLYIHEAFDRNWVAPLGFNVDGFEAETVQYLNAGAFELYALALTSGTAALHMAVKLAGIRPGDVVLCSDMTFAATVNPIVYEGGIPVFIDSERETWNMDPQALEKAFEKYSGAKAVMLVHLYGTPAKLGEIQSICQKHGAVLIEDAAESLAATYKGRQTGTFGDFAAISFNGNKLITTSGGGMLLTKQAAAREKAFFWSTQAREKAPWYQHEEIGYNYRLSNVLAGIGRGQLLHLEEHRSAKEAIYRKYETGLRGLPVSVNPYLPEIMKPNFWLSCMLLDEGVPVSPMTIMERLSEQNIECRPIWKPMHLQPVFAANDFISVAEKPVDEYIFAQGLCLPSDIKMTDEEQSLVVEQIRACFR